MRKTFDPQNAAAALIAHVNTLRKEMAYIGHVYSSYEGMPQLDKLLEEAGVLAEVKSVADVMNAGAQQNGG